MKTDLLPNVSEQRPCGIVWSSQTGVGKTVELALAFPDWYWLITDRTALAGAVRLIRQKWPKRPIPTKGKVFYEYKADEYDAQNNPIPRDTPAEFKKFMRQWEEKTNAGTNPFPGLVICEGSAIIDWIMAFYRRKYTDKDGHFHREDRFDYSRTLFDFNRWLVGLSKRVNTGLALEMHGRDARYTGKFDDGPRGDLKWQAGPDFGEGRPSKHCPRLFDFIFEMRKDDEDERYFLTQPSETHIRKGRGNLEEQEVIAGKNHLFHILKRTEISSALGT